MQRHQVRPRTGLVSLLVGMPVIAFGLGTWQVFRRERKLDLICEAQGKLNAVPLSSLAGIAQLRMSNADRASDMYPVVLRGWFDHPKAMFVGPRQHDGQQGFQVITPFVTTEGSLLVNRGWISKSFRDNNRCLDQTIMDLSGLIKEKPAVNLFTPSNQPKKDMFFYIDIDEMSQITGAQPILIEECRPEHSDLTHLAGCGKPLGRTPEHSFVNNHAQYIFTWFEVIRWLY